MFLIHFENLKANDMLLLQPRDVAQIGDLRLLCFFISFLLRLLLSFCLSFSFDIPLLNPSDPLPTPFLLAFPVFLDLAVINNSLIHCPRPFPQRGD